MNIAGTWTYKEEFEYGFSEGKAEFSQKGNEVTGMFNFFEKVATDYEIKVFEKVKGILAGNKLILHSIEVSAFESEKRVNYLPNTYEIYLVQGNKLAGSTFDSDNVCGVFVLEKE